MSKTTTAIEDARRMIRDHPQHLLTGARYFEAWYLRAPDEAGPRRIWFEFRRAVTARYPVAWPPEAEPPAEAWEDERHEFWTTDPFCVFNARFDALRRDMGMVDAQVRVHRLQARGGDLI